MASFKIFDPSAELEVSSRRIELSSLLLRAILSYKGTSQKLRYYLGNNPTCVINNFGGIHI